MGVSPEHGIRRFTPEQERARIQAFAQRDGFVIGFVRGVMTKAGAVGDVHMEQARKEAKGRFPIFAMCRRVVEDDSWRYRVSVSGDAIEVQPKAPVASGSFKDIGEVAEVMRRLANAWGPFQGPMTWSRYQSCRRLFEDPDEPFITDE